MAAALRTQLSLLVALFHVTGLCASALADELGTKYEGTVSERAHSVWVEQSGQDLVLRVQRKIRNTGRRVEQAELSITLPPSAVSTGLRSKQGGTWVPATLLDARAADATFEHFTTTGSLGAYGPALLTWSEEGSQLLRVFPVAPGDTAVVEYELRVPTCYRDGRRIAFYPRVAEESGMRSPRLRFAKGSSGRIVAHEGLLTAGDRKVVDECWEAGLVHEIDGIDEYQILIVEDASAPPVSVRYGRHALEGDRSIGELVVELAPQLEAAPKNAALVFVLDASISQGEEGLKQQLELVHGYLTHLPDAQFQIVVARRRAEVLFDEFQPASKASRLLSRLEAHQPHLGNGSNLDVGTATAAGLFAAAADRPQRIIAFTDARLRKSLDENSLQTSLSVAPRALLHVVDFQGGEEDYEFDRNDDHFLAPAVMATGGMWVTMFGTGNARAAGKAMLGLVRPLGIDAVSVENGEAWRSISHIPEMLPEGFGFRSMSLLEEEATRVRVSGKVWGRDFSALAEHDSGISLQIPAMAFGRRIEADLTTHERRSLANVGHVVSPETSYLARKPGLEPSAYSYSEDVLIGGSSMSFFSSHSSSCGGIRGVGHGRVVPRTEEAIDYGAAIAGLLEGRAAICATRHDVIDAQLTLNVETTGREIVDVDAPTTSGAYGTCVAEAAWSLRLGEFFGRHEGRVDVVFGR